MPGFPFRSFSKLLSGWNTSLEYRDRIGAYCAQNPDDPWGWLTLGIAQIYAGRPSDGLAALYRAEKQLQQSALASWVIGDALADSLAFEQALPFYERAIKLDPSLTRWSDKSERIQNIYSILGNPKKESNIRFGNPASPEELSPASVMHYGEWLMSQKRYLEAEAFLQSAWQRSQKGSSDSWISDMVLSKLLETMYKNGHIKAITELFKGDFRKVSEANQRYALTEFWSLHGLAESQMPVYQQWLSSPITGNDWLYNLPSSTLDRLLLDHRDLIRSKFAKPSDMIHFSFYKMNSCEDVLLEMQRDKEIIDDPAMVSIQVKCLHKLNRTQEAAKLISTVSAQKDNPYFKHRAGDLWLEIGEAKRARDAYMAEIADGSNYWRRWQGLGQAYQALGEEDKASDAFSRALHENKKGLEDIFGHHGGSGEAFPVELTRFIHEAHRKQHCNAVLAPCKQNCGGDFRENGDQGPLKWARMDPRAKSGYLPGDNAHTTPIMPVLVSRFEG
jgi:tetratricopeptide (TPR) repeat protein